MRKKDSPFSMFLIGIMLCVVSGSAMAQSSVGIGDNASTPDPSSVLDVSAEDRGLLVPRVLLIHTDSTSPVVAPAAGLLVYNIASVTNVAPGYYYWNGTNWERLSTASETVTTVNAGDGLTGGGSSTVITVDVGAGQGIDVAADEVSVDVTDILGTGLSETANTINVEYGSTASTAVEGNQTVDIFAGTGLTGGTITDALGDGVVAPLDVGAGDGIEVSSTAVSVDVTDLLGAGLSESSNNIIVNYGTGGGTAVQGNQTATINAGAGLTGGISSDALGDGFSTTVNVGAGAGIDVADDSISLTPSGVTPGSYTLSNVTVDTFGRVTDISSGVAGAPIFPGNVAYGFASAPNSWSVLDLSSVVGSKQRMVMLSVERNDNAPGSLRCFFKPDNYFPSNPLTEHDAQGTNHILIADDEAGNVILRTGLDGKIEWYCTQSSSTPVVLVKIESYW